MAKVRSDLAKMTEERLRQIISQDEATIKFYEDLGIHHAAPQYLKAEIEDVKQALTARGLNA